LYLWHYRYMIDMYGWLIVVISWYYSPNCACHMWTLWRTRVLYWDTSFYRVGVMSVTRLCIHHRRVSIRHTLAIVLYQHLHLPFYRWVNEWMNELWLIVVLAVLYNSRFICELQLWYTQSDRHDKCCIWQYSSYGAVHWSYCKCTNCQ
jgi:hypothetical protein